MNLKLRLKNKPVLIAIVSATVAFIYQILGLCGIVPPITEEQVLQVIGIIINVLVGFGILVDPTTAGFKDSARAMQYDEPNRGSVPDAAFPMGGEDKDVTDDILHEVNDPEDQEV